MSDVRHDLSGMTGPLRRDRHELAALELVGQIGERLVAVTGVAAERVLQRVAVAERAVVAVTADQQVGAAGAVDVVVALEDVFGAERVAIPSA
jgi:hypothetical protein